MVVESRRSRIILHVRVVVIFVAGICPNDYVMPQQNECVCVCGVPGSKSTFTSRK